MAGKRTTYDLILRGGRVVDPAKRIDGVRDVAVKDGKIAALAPSLDAAPARKRIDVAGKLVLPGLIDAHAHVYEYVTGPFGIDPALPGIRSGVTTLVDQGTANAFTFAGFRKFVVERATANVYSFISIYSAGALYGYLNAGVVSPHLIDVDVVVETVRANRDVIRGIKVQAEAGTFLHWGADTFALAHKAARAAAVPLYVHLGHIFPKKKGVSVDPRAIVKTVMPQLEAGDIIAHPFSPDPGCFAGADGKIYPEIRAAIARGVRVDVGRGSAFSYETARAVLDQGVVPDTLGVDLHGLNIRPGYFLNSRQRFIAAGIAKTVPAAARRRDPAAEPANRVAFSMAHVMTAMRALGLELDRIVRMTTVNAARMIGRERRHGSLAVGRAADVTVLDRESGRWTLRDLHGNAIAASERLTPCFVLKDGIRHASDLRVDPRYEEPAPLRAAAE
jgi:dihydroorotase